MDLQVRYATLKDFEKHLEPWEKALESLERLNYLSKKIKEISDLKDLEKALELWKKALEDLEKLKDLCTKIKEMSEIKEISDLEDLEKLKYLCTKIKEIPEIKKISKISKTDRNKISSLINNVKFEITQVKSQALEDKIDLENLGNIKGSDIRQCWTECDNIKNIYKEYSEIKFKISKGNFSKSVIDWIDGLEKELKEILQKKFDIELEWILPTSTIEMPTDYEAVMEYFPEQSSQLEDFLIIWNDFIRSKSRRDKNDIDEFFINKLMTVDRINTTLSSWKEFNNVQHRYPILKEALEAHNESNFFLSVSTLIPQVEGVIRDIIEKNTNITNMKKISDCDGLSNRDIDRAIKSLELIWRQKHINNIGNILRLSQLFKMLENLYKDDREIPNNDGLYRKGICHGGITNFGNAKNSLKLILVLDRLIFSFMI
ncbi:hypothetical protein [Anabaena sp. PCC 7108]|uniref:hypothetical protein n=1 Tax=Anabaena sp. PCC 7108 TaxID=163908 RepID=UPI0003455BA1|nr:hypothetical protein [Anabaena sp. PCC 7108]